MSQNKTAFVLVSDNNYVSKALITIRDLRVCGNWDGDIVLICIEQLNFQSELEYFNVKKVSFEKINKDNLIAKLENGFPDGDKREFEKINQWEKIHVFDNYFKNWNRIVYLDAGLRVLDSVEFLLSIDYRNSILAQNDGGCDPNKKVTQFFGTQISYKNQLMVDLLKTEYGSDVLTKEYFLNCMWIYDTSILSRPIKDDLIYVMNNYILCKTNEMTAMNLILNFKYKLWKQFPYKTPYGKYFFDWSDLNNRGTSWENYNFIKYPVSIRLHQYVINNLLINA